MRTLNPVDDKQILRQSAIDKKINEEIENLGEQIRALQTQQSTDEQALQDYKDQNTRQIDTDKLNADDITASTLVTSTLSAGSITSTNAALTNATIDQGTFNDITVDDEVVNNSKITPAEIGSETVDNSIIGGLIATNATIENLNITGDYSFTDIDATSVDSDQITTSQLISTDLVSQTADIASADIDNVVVDTAVIDNMTSLAARIQDLENTQLYHKFNVQVLQDPAAGAKNIIEIPFFASGEYVLTLRDNQDKEIFSVYVTNSFSNLTFAYSRAAYTTGEPASLTDAKIKTYNTDPQLYLSTERGGKLYWHYSGRDLLLDSSPNTWATWPFPIQADTMNYITYHRAATVFSQHLDYGDNTSPAVGGATLYLTPTTDYAEHTNTGVEYNTQSDVPFNVYVPDQSVNTNNEVKFKKVAVDELAITSITENFMFLRSRTDGTFEVVLAINNDTIQGMENVDNPVTAKAIYNWNGIALGGDVDISNVICVDGSNYICTVNGSIYTRTQYVNKTPDATHLDTKAIKKKVGADYLPFLIVSTGEYASREYVHYEVQSGDYAGLYFDFFTDDTGELYQSNYQSFEDFDDVWCIPTTLYDAYLLPCKHYSTTKRYPVVDNEGTNEYHITHLGNGTVVHGAETITGSTLIQDDLTVEGDLTASTLTVTNTVETPSIHDTVSSLVLSAPSIDVNGNTSITGSTLTVTADTDITGDTSIAGNTEITGSTLDITASTTINGNVNQSGNTALSGSTLHVTETASTIVSSPFIGITASTLSAPSTNGIFDSINAALVKAAQLRTSSDKIYIDNENNENSVALEATFDASTPIDLTITKPTGSPYQTITVGDTFEYNGNTYTLKAGPASVDNCPIACFMYNDRTVYSMVVYAEEANPYIQVDGVSQIADAFNPIFGDPIDWSHVDSIEANSTYHETPGSMVAVESFRKSIGVQSPAQLKLGNQFIAKRADPLTTNLPLAYDGDVIKEAVSVPFINSDTALKKALIAERADTSTTAYELKWSEDVGGGGSGTTLVLTQAEYDTRKLITDMTDTDYIPNNALVIITDADEEYLTGEEE